MGSTRTKVATVYLDLMLGNTFKFLNNIPALREGRSLIATLWHFYGVLKMAGRLQFSKAAEGRKKADRDEKWWDPSRAPHSSVWKTYGVEGYIWHTSDPVWSKKKCTMRSSKIYHEFSLFDNVCALIFFIFSYSCSLVLLFYVLQLQFYSYSAFIFHLYRMFLYCMWMFDLEFMVEYFN